MTSGKFGKGNGKAAKLTVREVQEMRELYASGQATQGDLCRRFRISLVQVGRIVRGESWQDVPVLATPAELEQSARRLLALQEELTGGEKLQQLAKQADVRGQRAQDLLNELSKEDSPPESDAGYI